MKTKAIIRKNVGIDIIPASREELLELYKLWDDSNVQFEKAGCCLHGDRQTKHSIANSSFLIKFKQALRTES